MSYTINTISIMQFSFQMYSARNFLDTEDNIKLIADIGYKYIEGYGDLFKNHELLKQLLAKYNLTMPSAHFDYNMLINHQNNVLELVELFKIKTIICPFLQIEDRPSNVKQWIDFSNKLLSISEFYTKLGYNFGWHNHDFEFFNIDKDIKPIKIILDNTNIFWEVDIAWIFKAKTDPLPWIKEYKNRIIAVHLKDINKESNQNEEDGWADFGHGIINWQPIISEFKKSNISLFIMEHDNPNNLNRFANRSFLKGNAMFN